MEDLQKALKYLEEIEQILNRHNYAEPNPNAVRRIRFLATQLLGIDAYIAEKASRIASLAAIFYSDRKHLRHPGGAQSLHTEMSYDLPSRIRGQISTLKGRAIQRDDIDLNPRSGHEHNAD